MQPKYWYCHSLSQRSNSFHSQSLNTCSSIISTNHYQQQPLNQLRYKEVDLMKLKRPLIVSFRKIPCDTTFSHASSFESGSTNQITDVEQLHERTHMLDSLRLSINETINPVYSCYSEKDSMVTKFENSLDYNTQRSNHKIITWLDHYSKFNKREKMHDENLTRSCLYNSTSSVPMSNASCRKQQLLPFQKKLYTSPYNSPEMTYDSKKLEENLNVILKQLVFKNETINGQFKQNGKHSGKQFHRSSSNNNTNNNESMSKSKSVPCFSTTIDTNHSCGGRCG